MIIWLQNIGLLVSYTISSALLPLYIQHAGYASGSNGFILGMSSIGAFTALIFMGREIDRRDCRVYIALGAFIWMVISLGIAFTSFIWLLIPGRFLQGFGYVIFYTASLVYATRSVSGELRGSVVGILEAIGAFAIGLTPFLAYGIQGHWGYRPAFLVAALVALVTFASVILLPARPLDTIQPEGIKDNNLRVGLLSRKAIRPGIIAAFLFFTASSFVNLAPLVAQLVYVGNLSLYLSIRALATVPTRLYSGYIADRNKPDRVIIPGFILGGLAMALVPFIRHPTWALFPPLLFGIGMGLASPALTAWMLNHVNASERATAVNTFNLLTESAGFIGTWRLGLALQSASLVPFWGMMVVMVTGLILYVGFTRSERRYELKLNVDSLP